MEFICIKREEIVTYRLPISHLTSRSNLLTMKFTYMTTVFLTLALIALAQDPTTSTDDDSTYTTDLSSTTDDYPLSS